MERQWVISAGEMTSVFVFFEEWIPQREQDCKAGRVYKMHSTCGRAHKEAIYLGQKQIYTLGEECEILASEEHTIGAV